VNESYQLHQGDKVFIYTDGLTEWRNQEFNMFGVERAIDCLKNNRELDLDRMLNIVIEEAKKYSEGNPCVDDLTILGFQYIVA